jgi:hypothetical protein
MLFGTIFERFATKTPVTVMLRGVLERALEPEALDLLFANTAKRQYTRELLFSTTVDLMANVACRIQPSVHAAYQGDRARVAVSVRALYDKLACTETALGEGLVRHTADILGPILRRIGGTQTPLVEGYTTKILDGNHLGASERRLEGLRDSAAGALPGHTLVVLQPEYQLATDVFCCEDGHAQERSMLDRVLARAETRDLYIADRNFCTTGFLFGLADRNACFLIRQHGSTLSWERESKRRGLGRVAEGEVYERTLWLKDDEGRTLRVRQVTLVLDQPTRDGETEIRLLTNLPRSVVLAKRVAQLYKERWTIEGLFLNLTTVLNCEMNTLPYPKAALFGFCVALAAGNVLAAIKGALGAVHGAEKIEAEVSNYHLAVEVRGKYQGMMVALPPEEWAGLRGMSEEEFADWLLGMARRVNLRRFPKSTRGPKKPRTRRTRFAGKKHIATARLLNGTYDTK